EVAESPAHPTVLALATVPWLQGLGCVRSLLLCSGSNRTDHRTMTLGHLGRSCDDSTQTRPSFYSHSDWPGHRLAPSPDHPWISSLTHAELTVHSQRPRHSQQTHLQPTAAVPGHTHADSRLSAWLQTNHWDPHAVAEHQ